MCYLVSFFFFEALLSFFSWRSKKCWHVNNLLANPHIYRAATLMLLSCVPGGWKMNVILQVKDYVIPPREHVQSRNILFCRYSSHLILFHRKYANRFTCVRTIWSLSRLLIRISIRKTFYQFHFLTQRYFPTFTSR